MTPRLSIRHVAPRLIRRTVPLSLGLLGAVILPTVIMPTAIAQERNIAQENSMTRTITVTGQGEESIPTTLTDVSLGVEVQGQSAEAAQREAARRANAVVDLLRSRNVQDLETTEIRLNPVYNYQNDEREITGYTATNIVSFRLPTEQVGSLLDDAIAAGATRINNVSFAATDDAIAAARQQALQEATQDARQQAEVVLQSLGLSSQEIVGIQVNGASAPAPQFSRTTFLRGDEASRPAPVVGGEQDVRASVTLQIRY